MKTDLARTRVDGKPSAGCIMVPDTFSSL